MSEKKIIDKIGAMPVKNSGRGMMKGDYKYHGQKNKYIGDVKEGKSFDLSEKSWAKIRADAMQHGIQYQPMILRVFSDGTMVACIDWYILEELEYFDEFMKEGNI
jgi:hypothetical protein